MNLTTAHSLWLAPLCLLLGAVCAWLLYRGSRERNGWGAGMQWTLGALRALAVALIAFFLLEPLVRVQLREVRKPVVVVAHDGSSSLLAIGDSTAFKTAYAERLRKLAEELGDSYEVRPFTYGSAVSEGLDFAQGEGNTDIDQLFRAVYDRFAGTDLGAVVIDGDGIYNRGRDPVLSAERLGVPVFAVELGDTTVYPDLQLRGLEYNRITYLGNDFPVLVRVQAHHLKGRSTRVVITKGGKEMAAKDIAVTGDPYFTEIPLMVKAETAGLQRYTVSLRAIEGEATLANNSQDLFVDVLDDRRKVLLLENAPHPDVAAIAQAMRGIEGYSLEVRTPATFTGKIAGYDLVILHQLPSAQVAMQDLLKQIDERHIPTWTILGQSSDLRQASGPATGIDIQGGRGSYNDVQASVDKNFSLFTLEPEDIRAFERFPPLQVPFGQYALGRSATALMSQRIGAVATAYPLFAFQANAERRTAVTCGEGLWRWRLADMQQGNSTAHFDKLVRQTMQFLALKQDKSRFRVKPAQEYAENEKVGIDAELYNASFEPVNSTEATITLKDEAGNDLAYTFSPNGTGYHLDAGMLPSGRYTWTAGTTLDGERLTAKGEFLVKPLVAERISTVADHTLWQRIAARTNGIAVPPSDMGKIAEAIAERPEMKARSYAHDSFSDLIGLRWLFLPILLLLAAEWFMRRRNGAY
ncbi:MAG: hypothetical protein IPN44_01940 [Flavobacteriales bacterium]|nr:hypothetical protein [Flavobacteriales bacterium]